MVGVLKTNKWKIAVVLLIIAVSILVLGMRSLHMAPVSWAWYGPVNAYSGVAMGGYDPVAYHVVKNSQKGSPENSFNWQGVNWHFTSLENKNKFAIDPDKFAPQFGGYCAFAVSSGFTATSNAPFWSINNGKLNLFFDKGAKQKWLAQIEKKILLRAENNWAKR